MGGSSGGGGTSTTTQVTENSYDPVYNARMADIAERQLELQEEALTYYEEVYKPYETEAVDLARANLAGKGALDAEQIAAQRQLLGSKTALEEKATLEQIRDIEANRELRDAAREEQMREIQRSSIVADKFYDTALKGVNVQERLDQATADVQQGFTQAQATTARMAGRYGVGPSGSDFTSSGLEQAKALSGVRTLTRRTAEQESFGMLQSAMAARGQGVASVPDVSGTGSIPYTSSGGSIADRYSIANPAVLGQQYGAVASQGYGTLASQLQSSTTTATTTGGSGGGVGILGGAMAGAGAGAAFGPWGAAIGGGVGAIGGMFG